MKRKISRTACLLSRQPAVRYVDRSGRRILHYPKMGVIYDLCFPFSGVPDWENKDVKSVDEALATLLESCRNRDSADSENESPIARQASMFLTLVDTLGTENSLLLIPTFNALFSCTRAGWRAKNIPEVHLLCSPPFALVTQPCAVLTFSASLCRALSQGVIRAAVDLLNHTRVDGAQIGRDLLMAWLEGSPSLCDQIVILLLEDIDKLATVLSAVKVDLLIHALDHFLGRSFQGLLSTAAILSSQSQGGAAGSADAGAASAQPDQMPLPNLGELVEVNVNNEWRPAVVVRVDAVTRTCSVEYAQRDIVRLHRGRDAQENDEQSDRGDEDRNDEDDAEEMARDEAARENEQPQATSISIVPLQSAYIRKARSSPGSRSGEKHSPLSDHSLSLNELLNQIDHVSKVATIIYCLDGERGFVTPPEGEGTGIVLGEAKTACECPAGHACTFATSLQPELHPCSVCKKLSGGGGQSDDSSAVLAHYFHCAACNYLACLNCAPTQMPACYRTLCLVGGPEKLWSTTNLRSTPIGELHPGCTIDVVDCPGEPFYRLVSERTAYVRKNLPAGSIWREVAADRYAVHEDETVLDRDDTMERPSYLLQHSNMKTVVDIIRQYLEMNQALRRETWPRESPTERSPPGGSDYATIRHIFLEKALILLSKVRDLLCAARGLPFSFACSCLIRPSRLTVLAMTHRSKLADSI